VPVRTIIENEFRLLTFRGPDAGIQEQWKAHLAVGLLFTWFAGIGRYWDNPKAHLWQHLGFGSVVYVFVLALIIWAFIAPLRPRDWAYRNVLVFITLTAPPALLYAIPVEKFLSLSTAQDINVWFLAVVALWRVVLLVLFLKRTAGLSGPQIAVAAFLPLTVIVTALAALNLEHVVFEIMAGLREEQRTGNDAAYVVVLLLSVVSVYLSPVLLAAYGWFVYRVRRRTRA
jgi:hypothetical protein